MERAAFETVGRVGKLNYTKTRIVKEDGRYLIYYSFDVDGEDEASPAEDKGKVGDAPTDEAAPPATA